jgi:hypothetical protein
VVKWPGVLGLLDAVVRRSVLVRRGVVGRWGVVGRQGVVLCVLGWKRMPPDGCAMRMPAIASQQDD